MKKASKIIFVAALIAMVMALTSCGGLSDDKIGKYLPVKVVHTETGNNYVETINWTSKTFSTTESGGSYWGTSDCLWFFDAFDVGKTKAKMAETWNPSNGIDGIEWYGSDHDKKVKMDGQKVVVSNGLLDLTASTFEPSDDPNYKFMVVLPTSSSGVTRKAYYNIFR